MTDSLIVYGSLKDLGSFGVFGSLAGIDSLVYHGSLTYLGSF